jgi:hypothetical protein
MPFSGTENNASISSSRLHIKKQPVGKMSMALEPSEMFLSMRYPLL